MKQIVVYDGVSCCSCGSRMPVDAMEHPLTLEFINGYPAICWKAGAPIYVIEPSELPWLRVRTCVMRDAAN